MTEHAPLPRPPWLRPALGGAVALFLLLTFVLSNCWCDPPRWQWRLGLGLLIGLVWAIELFVRPLPKLLLTLGVTLPVGWLIVTDNGSVVGLFLLLLVGWQMYDGALRDGLIASGLSVLAVLGYVHFDSPDRWLPWILGISATAVMMRLFVVQWRLVLQLRAAQQDLARQAAATERRRIASEIHDVAAHSLAVTLLHLTGARLRVLRQGGDPQLVEALAEAERLGRQSLDDVRRTVGLLQDSATGTAPPLPTATDISRLIDEFRSAGLDVCFELQGEPAAVPAATGLALYRIAQEALANAVKHAPGTAVRVVLSIDREAALRVTNGLPPMSNHVVGSGLGLDSMAERARLLGGTLSAGPHDAGWLVECSVPVGGP